MCRVMSWGEKHDKAWGMGNGKFPYAQGAKPDKPCEMGNGKLPYSRGARRDKAWKMGNGKIPYAQGAQHAKAWEMGNGNPRIYWVACVIGGVCVMSWNPGVRSVIRLGKWEIPIRPGCEAR